LSTFNSFGHFSHLVAVRSRHLRFVLLASSLFPLISLFWFMYHIPVALILTSRAYTAVSVTLESFSSLLHPVAMAVCAGEDPDLYDKFEY